MILPDYLVPSLDAVFCGTAAGNTSAARGHYFANAGNTFWDVLQDMGLTRQLLASERDHEITAHGLGLTDLVKLHAGADSTLRKEMYDIAGFERKIRAYKPRYVAFSSKEAAANYYGHGKTGRVSYGLQEQKIGETRLFVLPSTSGLARRHWDESFWREFAALIRARAHA